MVAKIQMRRGTAEDWTTANPVLDCGEIGYETDTRLFKFGDGLTKWEALPYANNMSSILERLTVIEEKLGITSETETTESTEA